MNITPVQNNNLQSFTGLKFRNGGAERLERFFETLSHSDNKTYSFRDEFTRATLEPIKKFTDKDVILDGLGDRVFVRDNISGRLLEVADEQNGRLLYPEEKFGGNIARNEKLRPVILGGNGFVAHVKENGKLSDIHLTTGNTSSAEDEVRNVCSGLWVRLNIARRLIENI